MGALDSPYLLEHECTGELCDFHIRYVADNVPGGCRRPYHWTIWLIALPTAWNVLVDLVLAALPIPIIWRTSLTLKQRIATCTLLGLGPLLVFYSLISFSLIDHTNFFVLELQPLALSKSNTSLD